MDMLRRFRQIRTQTTRGKENSEIRSSAATTIGKNSLVIMMVLTENIATVSIYCRKWTFSVVSNSNSILHAMQ